MEHQKFDFHTHSIWSDGTDTPEELVKTALESGVRLLALSDHDSVLGVRDAIAAGKAAGLPILPAVEMDNEWPTELHILGLGIDPDAPKLAAALEIARERREVRNAEIVRRLEQAGIPVAEHLHKSIGATTRLHIGQAVCKAGFAENLHDAFQKYLDKGRPGYYCVERFSPREVIALIESADGMPVLAHPCHLRDNVQQTVRQLVDWGIRGIEAYYPTSTPGQTQLFLSLAAQYGLTVTAGSDYHGKNRKDTLPGCSWQDVPVLEKTFAHFLPLSAR